MRSSSFLVAFVSLTVLAVACGREAGDFVDRMAREHAGDAPVASPAATATPSGAVISEEVAYAVLDGVEVRGYLARPEAAGPRPGLVVIHEWWGLNDNIRAMTRRLAAEGYSALAVDLYEGEAAADRDTAARLARGSAEKSARLEENLRQAVGYLEQAGATGIGTIGWCFGGGWSLRTAVLLPDRVDACVVYYGRLVTEADALRPLQAPVLGIFGDQDRGIPPATVREFEAALDALGKESSIHIYEGADHAFANPSGTRYNAEAAEDAWSRTVEFLGRNLGVVASDR